jgi:hypothetical protein
MSNEDDADAIAAEFAASWNRLERFYGSLAKISAWTQTGTLMPLLIRQMQQKGYDRILRAGTSHATLRLSRVRGYGLKQPGPRISVYLAKEGGLTVRLHIPDGENSVFEETTTADASLTPEIEALLQRLAAYPID